jgi:hypothetical protein
VALTFSDGVPEVHVVDVLHRRGGGGGHLPGSGEESIIVVRTRVRVDLPLRIGQVSIAEGLRIVAVARANL